MADVVLRGSEYISYELIKRPVEQRFCTFTNNMSNANTNGNSRFRAYHVKMECQGEGPKNFYIPLTDSVGMSKVYLILDTCYLIAVTLEKSFTISDF